MFEFINNVFCRRDSNQHKARKFWNTKKQFLPPKVKSQFEIEWNHYLMGEFDGESFGEDIEKLKPHLRKLEQ